MLATINCSADAELTQKRVNTAVDRLIALEHELLTVQAELSPKPEASIPARGLKAVVQKASRKFRG